MGAGEKAVRVAVARAAAYTEPAGMPLGFARLPPVTPGEVGLSFYDGHSAPLPEWFEEDAVAIWVDGVCPGPAQRLADTLRLAGKTVLLLGHWPTLYPEEAKRYADSVLCGDAGALWAAAMADLAAGALAPYYRAAPGVPAAWACDYAIFPRGAYAVGAVAAGAGCRWGCAGCRAAALHGDTVCTRPAEEVSADLKKLRQRAAFFEDDNLFASQYELEELLAAIAPLGKRWGCRLSPDAAADAAVLAQLRGAGCVLVEVCLGALDAAAQRRMGRPDALVADCDDTVAGIHAAGMMAAASFVVTDDEPETLAGITAFARRRKLAGLALWPEHGRESPAAREEANRLARACRETEAGCYGSEDISRRGLACAANRRHLGAFLQIALDGRRRALGAV